MPHIVVERAMGWMSKALCAHDPTLSIGDFYPERGATDRKALTCCFACPVRLQCLGYAMDKEKVGVWGGTRGDQRAEAHRKGFTVEYLFALSTLEWADRNNPRYHYKRPRGDDGKYVREETP